MASSGRDFKNLFSSPESTPVQEEANSPSPTAVREETAEPNEGGEEELITPVDEENEAHHVERNVIHSFGNFIYDIYEASSYGQPLTHNPPLNRLQYMQEYYRRMVQLLEASQRMEPASEETIRNLCINVYVSIDWCPICLEDYLGNCVTTLLPCGHRFHLCCIKKWLHLNHTCPVCKLVV
ncbi:hypothetical protein WA577_004818 [Blastocystis sp. JDR]